MAKPQHLDILKKGVQVWNRWRKENPETPPDLSHALLFGVNLSKADFHMVKLGGANLSGANLSFADLSGAKLSQEQLENARGNVATQLPPGATRPPHWMEEKP